MDRDSTASSRILESVKAARALAEKLTTEIKDERARKYFVQQAVFSLDDIESFLLPSAEKASTPKYAAMWIATAMLELRLAEQRLKRGRELLKQYGPSMVLIP